MKTIREAKKTGSIFVKPKNLKDFILSFPRGKFGTKAEIDAYIKNERGSWDKK